RFVASTCSLCQTDASAVAFGGALEEGALEEEEGEGEDGDCEPVVDEDDSAAPPHAATESRTREVRTRMGARACNADAKHAAQHFRGDPACHVEPCAKRPGVAGRYLVHTFGCQMNAHDSDRMEEVLRAHGWTTATGWDDCDLVVLNTCSVREKA